MSRIEHGDSIQLIKSVDTESIHLILSDIPYGINFEEWDVLHNNTNSSLLGKSPAQKKCGTVFKSRGKPLNGWSQADKEIPMEYYQWCKSWSDDWYRVLKPDASCFIFAGRRLAHRCICAMEDSGFIFKDMIAWEKDTAAYRAQRIGAFNELELKKLAVWNEGLEICSNILKVQTQKSDKGLHPTQKAVKLMEICNYSEPPGNSNSSLFK